MDVAEYIRRKQREQNKHNSEQKKQNNEQNNQTEKNNASQSNTNPQEAYNKYSKMNEEQLMQELFKVGSVSSGNVSPQALDTFFNNVRSRLTPEQAARMSDLIAQLKRS